MMNTGTRSMYVLTRNNCSVILVNCIQAHYQNNLENKYLLANFIEKHYENKRITESQLYVLVYLLFLHTNALGLLPGFCELYLPPSLHDIDLEPLHTYLEHAYGSVEEWNLMCVATGLVKLMGEAPGIPINSILPVITEAFETAKVNTSPLTPARQPEEKSSIVSLVEDESGASSPLSDVLSDVANSPLLSHRLKVVSNESDETEDKSKAARFPPASSVPHVGPVFSDSKAIIYRDSKPYIHGICGRGFAHPANVRHHHEGLGGGTRKGCKGTGRDKRLAWDDHPSCKISLKMLNYKSVAEGVILLDQESLDKVNTAIAAGLAFKDGLGSEASD